MFTEISNLLNDGEMLCLNIMKTGESLVVTVLPKSKEVKDPAAEQLIPLNLKGSPQELDSGFIEAIRSPVQKSMSLMSNMAEYEKSAEKASKESKAEKDRKDNTAKYIREAESAEKANKYKEAIATYTKALELNPNNLKIKQKISTLKMKLNGGCLDIFASAQEKTPTEKAEENLILDNENTDDDENESDNSDYPDGMDSNDPFIK